MTDEAKEAQVGSKAPDFPVTTKDGTRSLYDLAARHQKLILTSQDSYRYHPN